LCEQAQHHSSVLLSVGSIQVKEGGELNLKSATPVTRDDIASARTRFDADPRTMATNGESDNRPDVDYVLAPFTRPWPPHENVNGMLQLMAFGPYLRVAR
jgi:hypothetical protein